MEEKVLLEATVTLLVENNKVNLAIKTKKIGAGCRNGFGGGIEQGETPKECAIREMEDESGKKRGDGSNYITPYKDHMEKVAIMDFHNMKSDNSFFICRVHFFICTRWKGKATDTDEMIDLQPFNIDNLPFHEMMPADKQFFPVILAGKKIIGKAKYTPFQKELIGDVEYEIVDSLPED